MVAYKLLEATSKLQNRFLELEALIAAPEIIADNNLYLRLVLERSSIEDAAVCRKELISAVQEWELLQKESVDDAELKRLIDLENDRLQTKIDILCARLNSLIAAVKTEGSALLEIRGEGETSVGFVLQLSDFYRAAAKAQGFVIEEEKLPEGGAKGATLLLSGMGAYETFEAERGVHRAVTTESKNNAAATVIILKYLPYKQAEISEKDIRIDLFHSGGAGGQNVNKVETAVRITHLPTNIVVTCQDERSQLKNKLRAMENLRQKLEDLYKKQSETNLIKQRKEQFLLAKKYGKIRTYDFVSQTIFDHRTGISIKINDALEGKLTRLTEHYHLLNN